jgi:hypothetical protein
MCQVTLHVCLERDCKGGSKRYSRIAKECSNPERDQSGFPTCKELEVNDAKHPDFFRTCDMCSERNQKLHDDLQRAKSASDADAVAHLLGMKPILGMQADASAMPEQACPQDEDTTSMLPPYNNQAERWSEELQNLRSRGTKFVNSVGSFIVPDEWKTETYLGKGGGVTHASRLRYNFARSTAPKDRNLFRTKIASSKINLEAFLGC